MNDFDQSEQLGLDVSEQQALEALLAVPELTDQEWDGLRRKVLAACEPRLTRLNGVASRPRSSQLITWLRPVLPLAAAAVLVVMMRAPAGERAEIARDELTVAEQALLSDVSDAELTKFISGGANAEDLLHMAVRED